MPGKRLLKSFNAEFYYRVMERLHDKTRQVNQSIAASRYTKLRFMEI
jgi:hypothetical protein